MTCIYLMQSLWSRSSHDRPALIQVMAWCKISHYLNQCWPRFSMKHAFTGPSMEGQSLLLMHHVDDFPSTEQSNTTSDTWQRLLFNIQTFAQESVFICIQNFTQFAPTPMCFICEVLTNSRNAAIKVNNPLTPGRCGRNFNSSDVGDHIPALWGQYQACWCPGS